MVGLSVLLEGHRDMSGYSKCIRKTSMIKSPSSSSSSSESPSRNKSNPFAKNGGFLESCFLCKQKLLPGRDIYMYKGDRAFCSEECRCRQIFMDEEEMVKGKTHDHCSVASTSARKKGAKNPENGFAY